LGHPYLHRRRSRLAPDLVAAVRVPVLTPTGAMRAWATLLVVVVGFGLALGLTIGYVKKVDQAAERRNVARVQEICGLIRLIDDRNQKLPPPPDSDTAAFRAELHRYRTALGC
jgi:hypothetical protein